MKSMRAMNFLNPRQPANAHRRVLGVVVDGRKFVFSSVKQQVTPK